MKSLSTLAALVAAFTAMDTPELAAQEASWFPHSSHLAFVGECSGCHAGVAGEGSVYPDPAFCAGCHNGTLQPALDWSPPAAGLSLNMRFEHATHLSLAGNECADCHVSPATGGAVYRVLVDQCRACHANAAPKLNQSVWHGPEYRNAHASEAAASAATCAGCHVRSDCLDCHRPDAGSGASDYHPAGFLTSHPAAAYTRSLSCSDCHNVGGFCTTCHATAGLVANGPIGNKYHDAKANFATGHGQMARQNLESCVACHTEVDCLRCHSALSGRIKPHGPGFDADKLEDRNPQMCAVCHGRNIPDDP